MPAGIGVTQLHVVTFVPEAVRHSWKSSPLRLETKKANHGYCTVLRVEMRF